MTLAVPGDIFALAATATPSGSILSDETTGGVSIPPVFIVATNPNAGGPSQLVNFAASTYMVAFGVTGDVFDLVVDGTTVHTSPLVPLYGAGNTLTYTLLLASGAHTFNVVSHLVPLANQVDPYGGGTVPAGYTGISVEISWQNDNQIAYPTNLAAVWSGLTSATVSWVAPVLPAGITTFGYDLQWAPHGTTDWTTITGISSGATSQVVTGLSASESYDFQVGWICLGGAGPYYTGIITIPPQSLNMTLGVVCVVP
jgi:Fibronectin type III domain